MVETCILGPGKTPVVYDVLDVHIGVATAMAHQITRRGETGAHIFLGVANAKRVRSSLVSLTAFANGSPPGLIPSSPKPKTCM